MVVPNIKPSYTYGDPETVQVLLDYKVDAKLPTLPTWQRLDPQDTLQYSSMGLYGLFPFERHNNLQSLPDVARLLLERGADLNARIKDRLDPTRRANKDGPNKGSTRRKLQSAGLQRRP